MKRRILSALILISVILSVISCTETPPADSPGQAGTGASGTDTETAPADAIPDFYNITGTDSILEIPQDANFDGYNFNVLVFDKDNINWSWSEISPGEMTGEALNDAFYTRNLQIEERLNITITQTEGDDGSIPTMFMNSITSGDNAYSCGFFKQQSAAGLATNGYCIDLGELPHVNFDKPWWDANSLRDLSIGSTRYLAASDITVGDKEATWVIFFDKLMAENYLPGENLYNIVKEGNWTFDKMGEFMKATSQDLDNDGKWTENDQYGLLTHGENYPALWIAAESMMFVKDEKDLPQINYTSEKFINVWDAICKIMGDESCYTNSIPFISTGLRDGQTLFATEVIAFTRIYRENERDFGIIPMPKYSGTQKNYESYVALGTTLMAVGKDMQDEDRTGIILEALAAKGRQVILPEYYERSIKYRDTRDEESIAMLDIIFANRRFDLGIVYDWGGMSSSFRSTRLQVASVGAKKRNLVEKAVQKTMESFGIEHTMN